MVPKNRIMSLTCLCNQLVVGLTAPTNMSALQANPQGYQLVIADTGF